MLHADAEGTVQTPVVEQQPVGHEVESQTHWLPTHRRPGAHAGPVPHPAAPPAPPPAVEPPATPPAVLPPAALPPAALPPAVLPPAVLPPASPPATPPLIPPAAPPAAPPEMPPPTPPMLMRMHEPTWQNWFCAHARQDTPEAPQKSTVPPVRQVPDRSQQPRHVSAQRRGGAPEQLRSPVAKRMASRKVRMGGQQTLKSAAM